MPGKQKYLVFVDDRGRYKANLKNSSNKKDGIEDFKNFGTIFKNQNQEMNGQDSYGLFFIPEDEVGSFKKEYEELESNLKDLLNKQIDELKSSQILSSINASSGLFLNSAVAYFYFDIMQLIDRHHGFFHFSRIDWVNIFLIKRLQFFITSNQIEMYQLRELVKYMYQYATPQLKKQLYQFDISNGEFFDSLCNDVTNNIQICTSKNNPYANSRASWLIDLRNRLFYLDSKKFDKSEKISFNLSYDEFESAFLLSEIKKYADADNISDYSIIVDEQINVDGSSIVKSNSVINGFGIRVVDMLVGYIAKLITALMKLLHNDYSKDMSLEIQGIPDKFWFPKYLSKSNVKTELEVAWTYLFSLEVMKWVHAILAESIILQENNAILNLYSDNYDNLMAFISMYADEVFKYISLEEYEDNVPMPLHKLYHIYRIKTVAISEKYLSNNPLIIPQFVL